MLTNRLVETDAYDRAACARALLLTPEARGLVERGLRILPHFDALLEDLFAIAFRRVICLREGPPSTALNHRLLSAVVKSPGLAALHEASSLDESRSASVALALGRATLAEVKKGELFTEEDLLDQAALVAAEERVAALDSTRSALRTRGGPVAHRLLARVEAAIASSTSRRDELAARVGRTVSSMPCRLEARLDRVAAAVAETLDDEEEAVRAFTAAVGARGPLSASDRVALGDRFRGSEKLRELTSLAGAFRREALAARRRRIRHSPIELHRVGRGADLSRILASELAGATHGVRRLHLLRRLAERDLAQHELAGTARNGRGPLIVCVDGSATMAGPKERWAKALTLALLDLARRQNRRAETIVFSGRESPLFRFSLLSRPQRGAGGRRRVDVRELLDFAATSPGGGTDFEKPLGLALELLVDMALEGGDVVFITDGDAPISEAFALDLARLKNDLDFALFAVLVDDRPAVGGPASRGRIDRARRELGKVADRLTTVTSLAPGAATDLFERIR